MPYCFFGSSIKFQGHTGWKIDVLNQIWVRLLGRSQLSNPSDLPCSPNLSLFIWIFSVGIYWDHHLYVSVRPTLPFKSLPIVVLCGASWSIMQLTHWLGFDFWSEFSVTVNYQYNQYKSIWLFWLIIDAAIDFITLEDWYCLWILVKFVYIQTSMTPLIKKLWSVIAITLLKICCINDIHHNSFSQFIFIWWHISLSLEKLPPVSEFQYKWLFLGCLHKTLVPLYILHWKVFLNVICTFQME